MQARTRFALVGVGILSLFPALTAQQAETLAWAPQPAQLTGWVAPNKPIWKLSELLRKHKGEQNWTETVVSDTSLHADYISMAPGVKTKRMFHPDTRAWWIVQDGQIRFTIEGRSRSWPRKDSWCRRRIAMCSAWKPWATSLRCAWK